MSEKELQQRIEALQIELEQNRENFKKVERERDNAINRLQSAFELRCTLTGEVKAYKDMVTEMLDRLADA